MPPPRSRTGRVRAEPQGGKNPEQPAAGQGGPPPATRVAAASGSSTNSKEEHSLSVAVETAGGEGEFVLKPDLRLTFTARTVGSS